MLKNDRYIDEVESEVLAYLDEHPNAADTAEGIRRWWLAQRLAKYSQRRVERALDHLVEAGWLMRRDAPDGRARYELCETSKGQHQPNPIHSLTHKQPEKERTR